MESYLRGRIDARNTEWFPLSRAMCLDDVDDGHPEIAALGKRMDAFSQEIRKLQAAVAALDPMRRA